MLTLRLTMNRKTPTAPGGRPTPRRSAVGATLGRKDAPSTVPPSLTYRAPSYRSKRNDEIAMCMLWRG